ncbi:MAG: Rieske 2Fe-2S domain-containing protein [Halobacteria archaeon]|nr:Rieske 2Fe-2S domain-containing protein [Halobacteria archaeon]
MSDSYVPVARTEEVEPGDSKVITVEIRDELRDVAVFNVEGEYYAIGNRCTHAGGPLPEGGVRTVGDDGEEDGDGNTAVVMCPHHGAEFDLSTGECLSYPASEDVPSYDVVVEDSKVLVGEPTDG